jgi:transposase InsO family protein
MAKALQRETAALIAWISAAGTRNVRPDPAARTIRRDAVISHSAWFKKIGQVRRIYRTRDEARADVFDYIERFYNPHRRHSTLGDESLLAFGAKMRVA